MNHLSLFSGIGGIDLAAHWAGMETVAFCEREPFPQKVLRKHWPDVPIYDDVCTLTADRLKEDGIIGPGRTIDIISGGYPCQPFSHAGKRQGKEDDRHLWPEVYRLLQEIRPRWFVGENVAGHVTLGLDDVLSDLGDIGYTAQPFIIPSAAVGAPHRRDRVFIAGYTTSPGFPEWRQPRLTEESEKTGAGMESEPERSGQNVADTCIFGSQTKGSEQQTTGTTRDSKNVAHSESNIEGRLPIRTGTTDARLACSGEDVANTYSEPGLETNQNACTIRSEWDSRDNVSRSSRPSTSRKSVGTIESRLGGVLDGLSNWLERYPWPAGQGAEQFDWEPPRVATGVKDRVGRLKALGNAVNPVQIYPILVAIKAIDDMMH
ncbi:putative BsuMI modification methylase subunit YdiP [compost metagenome]